MRQFVLIGAGHASVSTARALRRQGFDGNIIIVGDEEHYPYQRPALSKGFLTGDETAEDLLCAPQSWFAENNVELRLGVKASRINIATLEVELEDGSKLPSEGVLIATGGRVRKFENTNSSKVRYLRNIADAEQLKTDLQQSKKVLVVGGGFIGLEVAATAREMGLDVTLIEVSNQPLANILGAEIAETITDFHLEKGIELITGVKVENITDIDDNSVQVTVSDGQQFTADIVVVGIGIIPNDEIARASEITVGNGIRVDEFCRTSTVGVYAAGDVANHYHPLFDRRMRVEHFDNASRQGAVVASNMLGTRTLFDDPHWFWSEQYEYNLQYAGHVKRWDEIVIRGSVEDKDFIAFYLVGKHIEAVFGINRGGDVMLAKSLISAKKIISPEQLTDESTELEELVYGAEDTEPVALNPDDIDADGFLRAARSGQIVEGQVRRFLVKDTEIAIARSKGKTYAVHNLCTHLACHLASGRVDGGGLACLCHGSVFDLATGVPLNPPATKAVKTYPVREEDGIIYVALVD